VSFGARWLHWKWEREMNMRLTRASFRTGTRPAVWKRASGVALLKPGKDDYTQLQADRSVEILMLEKLYCILSNRATRPIYMKVQVRLNAISPCQSQPSSPAIRDISVSSHTRHLGLLPYKTPPSPALRDSSPAETCICNTPPLAILHKTRNK